MNITCDVGRGHTHTHTYTHTHPTLIVTHTHVHTRESKRKIYLGGSEIYGLTIWFLTLFSSSLEHPGSTNMMIITITISISITISDILGHTHKFKDLMSHCLLGEAYIPCIYGMPGGIIVGDHGLCCCVPVQWSTSIKLLFERNYFPSFVGRTGCSHLQLGQSGYRSGHRHRG